MLTSFKHFHTDVYITNLFSCSRDQQPHLKMMVAEFERKALVMLLGNCITNEIYSNLKWEESSARYIVKEDAPDRVKWLVNGLDYEFDGNKSYPCNCGCKGKSNCKKKSFSGLIQKITINPDENLERNYLAYFIYYNWQTINASITSGVGEALPKAENSTMVYNKNKRYNSWNRFVDFADRLDKFISDHKEHFMDAELSCLERINIWDL